MVRVKPKRIRTAAPICRIQDRNELKPHSAKPLRWRNEAISYDADDRWRAVFPGHGAMRDEARLNTFVFLPQAGGPRFPAILHRTPYGITLPQGQHVTVVPRGGCPIPKLRCSDQSCAAGAKLCGMGTPPSTKIVAGAMAPKERIAFTVTTLPMDTTRLNESRANPGPIIGLDSQAPQLQQRRRSLRRRSAIRQCVPFLPKSAGRTSMMT
jgi:hypothetical protein